MSITPAVYRVFDADGALLYIGSSRNPLFRLAEHGRDSRVGWFPLAARVDIVHYDTIDAALLAEAAAIAAEVPRFNCEHNPRRDRSREARRPERPSHRVVLGGRIRAARVRAGLDRHELAAACAVTPGAISHWENGRSVPSLARQWALATALAEPPPTCSAFPTSPAGRRHERPRRPDEAVP